MALQSSQAAAQALTGFNMINAKVSDMKPMTLLAIGAAPPACNATSEGGMTLQSPKAGADKEVNVCANSTKGVYAWGSVGGGGVKVYVFGRTRCRSATRRRTWARRCWSATAATPPRWTRAWWRAARATGRWSTAALSRP